jgi:hypothetical protein
VLNHRLTASVMAMFATTVPSATGQQIATSLGHDEIREAIAIAADDKLSARFLDAYVVQTRAGSGNGPLIGSFSTPFSRVILAARAAQRNKTQFGVTDLPAELLAGRVHVVATAQKAWPDDTIVAVVQSVVLAPIRSKNRQPRRTIELTSDHQALYGTSTAGIVAIFPLAALTPNTEIRVTFDRTAKGFSGLRCAESASSRLTAERSDESRKRGK